MQRPVGIDLRPSAFNRIIGRMKQNTSYPISKDRMVLVLLTALLVTRLAMVVAYPLLCRAMPQWAWSNNDGYEAIALNWAETGTFALHARTPTATRLPAYPALIRACYAVAGCPAPWLVMIVQALLSTATGYLLFRMTRTLFGRTAAIATLCLFILHPQANNFVFRCATETLFTFLVMAVLHSAVQYVCTRQPAPLIRTVAWLSLSLLTRQSLAPLGAACLPLLLLWCALDRQHVGRRLSHAAAAIAVAALILTPWIARNYAQSGRAPVLQTWIGQPLFQGTYVSRHLPEFLRGEKTITDLDMEALAVIRTRTRAFLNDRAPDEKRPVAREVVADRFARRVVREGMLAAPARYVGVAIRNLLFAPVLQMTWKSTVVLMLWNWPLLILAAAGLAWCLRRQPRTFVKALPVTVLFCYVLGVHAVVWPQARYVMPALMPFSAFAGLSIAQIHARMRSLFYILGDLAEGRIWTGRQ